MDYNFLKIILLACIAFCLSACQTTQGVSSDGKAVVAASQLFHEDVADLTVSRGPLVAGPVGVEIDQVMDRGDRDNMLNAIINQPINYTTAWMNPRRNTNFQVTPVGMIESAKGGACRQYQVVAIFTGEVKQGQGNICEAKKNHWQVEPLDDN